MFTGIEYNGYSFTFEFERYLNYCHGIKRPKDKLIFLDSMITELQKPELSDEVEGNINLFKEFRELIDLPSERKKGSIRNIIQKLITNLEYEKGKVLEQLSLDKTNTEEDAGDRMNNHKEETPVKIRWLKQNTDLLYLITELQEKGFIDSKPNCVEYIVSHFIDKDNKLYDRETLRKQKSNMLYNKLTESKHSGQLNEIIGNIPSGQ
jgi:hypothetical protein